MQYLAALLLAAAATGTKAASIPRAQAAKAAAPAPVGATVILSDVPSDTTTQTGFAGTDREQSPPVGSFGPYGSVALRLEPTFANKALRCQILDENNKPLTLTRGASIDTTFSDAGKGPWTIQKGESQVKQIICDPAFKATAATASTTTTTTTTTSATASATSAPPPLNNQGSGSASTDKPDTSIRVVLSDQQETGSQTPFTEAGLKREEHSPVATFGPFREVTLELGKDIKDKELRCQVINKKNKKPITLKRGTSVDVTFSDEGKGAWTFLQPYSAGTLSAEVLDIICDPAFVKKTQPQTQPQTQTKAQ